MTATRHVVIADDHPIMRAAVKAMLAELGNIEVVEEIDNGPDAVHAAKTRKPDLVILDLSMPDASGPEIFLEIRRQSPDTKIAVLTGLSSTGVLSQLVADGVDGLFLKKGDMELVKQGLNLVLAGGKFVAPDVVALLEAGPPAVSLSARERQTLNYISRGLTNAEIAARLNISPKTVDKHRTSLMAKLDVHSMSQLLAYALREGLLDTALEN